MLSELKANETKQTASPFSPGTCELTSSHFLLQCRRQHHCRLYNLPDRHHFNEIESQFRGIPDFSLAI